MTLFAAVVTASKLVSKTSSRSRKIAVLAELLSELEPPEVPVAVAFLSGVPRQGRVGIGYSTIYGLDLRPASQPSLSVRDLDRAISHIQGATGSGSVATRKQLLADLFGRATAGEAAFP